MNVRHKFLRRYLIGSVSSRDLFTYYSIGTNKQATESYIGTNQTPTVPNLYVNDDVLWIGENTFSGNTNVTGVTISNGIEKIG